MSEEAATEIKYLEGQVFRGNRDRLAEATQPGLAGAEAALDTFYYAFNNRSIEIFEKVWLDDHLIQLNNPLGDIVRSLDPIKKVYTQLFEGPVVVRVEFFDAVAFVSSNMVIFAGRERGSYNAEGESYPLEIRTTRCFQFNPAKGGWRQVHHHGSIDNAEQLAHYKATVTKKP